MYQLSLFADDEHSPIIPPAIEQVSGYPIETLAYAAGLFDAEGSVCIVEKRVKNHLPTYYLVANIANTHQPTIQWLYDTFSCGFLNKPKPSSPKHKPIWIWNMQSNPAASFLQTIAPYLAVKQEQAKVALAFYDYHLKTSHHGTEETAKRKGEYRQQIRELNQSLRETCETRADVSSSDIAYLAAFFDGEGSVKISMKKSRERGGNGFPLYTMTAIILNSDYPILLRYQSLFSGSLVPARAASTHKPIWQWHIGGDTAQAFLKMLLPHLKIKREQAQLAIEFQDYHRDHWQAIHIHCTPEVLARKEEYRQRISKLALYGKPIKALPERFNRE